MRVLWCCVFALGSLGCQQDVEGLGDAGSTPDGELDGGFDGGLVDPPLWALGRSCELSGRSIPFGMAFAEGCNECGCGPTLIPSAPNDCVGSICQAGCTAAGCGDAGPGRTCSPTNACPDQRVCFYEPGCAAPTGNCPTVLTRCNPPAIEWDPSTGTPSMMFCGCDGKTYTGGCPMVPYAHTGPCP